MDRSAPKRKNPGPRKAISTTPYKIESLSLVGWTGSIAKEMFIHCLAFKSCCVQVQRYQQQQQILG